MSEITQIIETVGEIKGTVQQIDKRLDKVEDMLKTYLIRVAAIGGGVSVAATIIINLFFK